MLFLSRARRVAAAIVLSLFACQASADLLAPIPVQTLQPGELLRYPITWQKQNERRVQIQLGSAPDGASLTVSNSGKLFVVWRAPVELPDNTVIDIIASDIDDGAVLDSRQLLIQPGTDSESVMNAEQSSDEPVTPVKEKQARVPVIQAETPGAMPAARSALSRNSSEFNQDDFVDPDTPRMPQLSNLIVSAGRVVNLRVSASIDDGTRPVLQVDRLPRNASFDANADGSRTFYWQTGDRDQGEHVYRFTAINPNESYLRTEREVLIVIGDPSRNKTLPAETVSSAE